MTGPGATTAPTTGPKRRRGRRAPAAAVLVAGALLAAGCAASVGGPAPVGSTAGVETTTTTATATSTAVTPPPDGATDSSTTAASSAATSAHDRLAPLAIDDGPPAPGYRRDEWPTWKDIDGDGCDAREQALVAASVPPATVGPHCHVSAGHWVSAYDGLTFVDPADLDIDHVVPLANAYRSGGSTWSTDRRASFANDQADLWAVSASSNRSKGDRGPEAWRPPAPEIWCTYATRWVQIKVRWGLTATTAERDALGRMLDTC